MQHSFIQLEQHLLAISVTVKEEGRGNLSESSAHSSAFGVLISPCLIFEVLSSCDVLSVVRPAALVVVVLYTFASVNVHRTGSIVDIVGVIV